MRGVDRSLKARGSEKDNLLKRGKGLTAMIRKRSGPFSIRVGLGRARTEPTRALSGLCRARLPPALSHAIRGTAGGPTDCHTPPLQYLCGEGDPGSVTVGPQVHEAGPSRTRRPG
mgnify:CR=1 FL=1